MFFQSRRRPPCKRLAQLGVVGIFAATPSVHAWRQTDQIDWTAFRESSEQIYLLRLFLLLSCLLRFAVLTMVLLNKMVLPAADDDDDGNTMMMAMLLAIMSEGTSTQWDNV